MFTLKYVDIGKCEPGQVIGKNIFDDRGVLLISKNIVLNDYVIKKLSQLGITKVPIVNDDLVIDARSRLTPAEQIKISYKKDIEEYKAIINALASGEKLDYERVDALTRSIYRKIYHNYLLLECLNSLREKDKYTFTHSVNVALYSMLIAKWLELSEKKITEVIQAGILHDVGKCKISPEILNKEGPLLPEEFEEVKNHPIYSYQMLKDIPHINKKTRVAVLMHHEREDGQGYPLAVTGDKLSLYTKIVAVADVYDALTSERVYKKRITPFDTFREFEKIGYGQFDVRVMLTFLTNIANFYIGSKVKMNTGEIGEIVFVPPYNISKPVVALGNKYIDLSKDTSYKIKEMVTI